MFPRLTEHQLNIAVMILGIAAAFFLLADAEPMWLRVLPWTLVFGYPVWRMVRAARSR